MLTNKYKRMIELENHQWLFKSIQRKFDMKQDIYIQVFLLHWRKLANNILMSKTHTYH